MDRIIRAWSLLALGFSLLAAPCRAGDSGRSLFDGDGGPSIDVPKVHFQLAQAGPPARPSAIQHPKQSGADLFYFTPEEAAEAARRFGPKHPKGRFTFDPDVPAAIQAQILQDLGFVYGIRGWGASAFHKFVFGPVHGSAYKMFFETRVTGIGMDDCGSPKAVACVIPYADPSKMWLTQNYLRFSHPQIARMMIVFHEARHTETKNGNWTHAYCPTPFKDANGNDMKSIWTGAPLAGEPACDVTPFGSYGSSTIMLKNIQKFCTSCTDKVKMDAGLYADDQLNRITDPQARRKMEDDFRR